jgi:GntR family transcriptional regulator/MocR family aminotransferase
MARRAIAPSPGRTIRGVPAAPTGPELLLDLDRATRSPPAPPLRERVEAALRDAIRAGRLRPGDRLPATRALAAELSCSRWVVVEAYAQLAAEGWVEGRTGSGTRVRARAPGTERPEAEPRPPAPAPPAYDFAMGVPDLVAFPRAAWLRALQRAVRTVPAAELGHGDPTGVPQLRSELAAYLSRVRGVSAQPRHVIVTHGFTHGLALVCRALHREGHTTIALEDPGFPLFRHVVRTAGLEPLPVPVDEEGLRVDALAATPARAVVAAPAHQLPLGHVMSPSRRADLLAWARGRDGLVVEDDYDAEFRYDRRPVGALQGLDREHVIYGGTASKSLAPALRMGWLVAPSRWRRAIAEVRWGVDLGVGHLDQLAMAELIASGGLDRHLRATRQRYAGKRRVLLEALAEHVPAASISGVAAGLHALVLLPPGVTEVEVVGRAAEREVGLQPLSLFYARSEHGPDRPGVVLGYAALSERAIAEGIRRLGHACNSAPGGAMAE